MDHTKPIQDPKSSSPKNGVKTSINIDTNVFENNVNLSAIENKTISLTLGYYFTIQKQIENDKDSWSQSLFTNLRGQDLRNIETYTHYYNAYIVMNTDIQQRTDNNKVALEEIIETFYNDHPSNLQLNKSTTKNTDSSSSEELSKSLQNETNKNKTISLALGGYFSVQKQVDNDRASWCQHLMVALYGLDLSNMEIYTHYYDAYIVMNTEIQQRTDNNKLTLMQAIEISYHPQSSNLQWNQTITSNVNTFPTSEKYLKSLQNQNNRAEAKKKSTLLENKVIKSPTPEKFLQSIQNQTNKLEAKEDSPLSGKNKIDIIKSSRNEEIANQQSQNKLSQKQIKKNMQKETRNNKIIQGQERVKQGNSNYKTPNLKLDQIITEKTIPLHKVEESFKYFQNQTRKKVSSENIKNEEEVKPNSQDNLQKNLIGSYLSNKMKNKTTQLNEQSNKQQKNKEEKAKKTKERILQSNIDKIIQEQMKQGSTKYDDEESEEKKDKKDKKGKNPIEISLQQEKKKKKIKGSKKQEDDDFLNAAIEENIELFFIDIQKSLKQKHPLKIISLFKGFYTNCRANFNFVQHEKLIEILIEAHKLLIENYQDIDTFTIALEFNEYLEKEFFDCELIKDKNLAKLFFDKEMFFIYCKFKFLFTIIIARKKEIDEIKSKNPNKPFPMENEELPYDLQEIFQGFTCFLEEIEEFEEIEKIGITKDLITDSIKLRDELIKLTGPKDQNK